MANRYILDAYVVDALLPDLVGHDRKASAFLVYLYLWCRRKRVGRKRGAPVVARASLQEIALETGLSKSAVQLAIRRLRERRLVRSRQESATAVPEYEVLRPWVRD